MKKAKLKKVKKENSMRVKIIDTIIEFSDDELDFNTAIEIAKETDEKLVDRLINILFWYHTNQSPKQYEFEDSDTLIITK
jgi:hypothetical protein